MRIIINNCNELEEALQIRKQYSQLCPNSEQVIVDLSRMCAQSPQSLLIGVLINIKRYFCESSKIVITNPPAKIDEVLGICKLKPFFEFKQE